MIGDWIYLVYTAAAICFVLALKGLSSPNSARSGNRLGIIGMILAIGTVIVVNIVTYGAGVNYVFIIVGLLVGGAVGMLIAVRIQMKAMPQLVAAFHSLVGLAAVLVAFSALLAPKVYGIADEAGSIILVSRIEMGLGLVIGAITFTGSIIAFLKLQGLMSGNPVVFPGQHILNLIIGLVILGGLVVFVVASPDNLADEAQLLFWLFVGMTALSLLIGILLIIPIGGADMPVVVSMLNSYSGWAAAGIGFTLSNPLLIITGALVGSSGAILSYIMVKAMNRSFISVILGGFGGDSAGSSGTERADKTVRSGSADDAAFLLENAEKVVVVPGYGMAVAQAQHAVRELYEKLTEKGVDVRFAIHPVAGRMPGHMNVLLAEANVPHETMLEAEDINSDLSSVDVCYVIGANDTTNPSAKEDSSSPLYGMPIIEVSRANTTLFIKRSLSPGYAGVDNDLFYREKTMMLFGDAKKMTEEIVNALS